MKVLSSGVTSPAWPNRAISATHAAQRVASIERADQRGESRKRKGRAIKARCADHPTRIGGSDSPQVDQVISFPDPADYLAGRGTLQRSRERRVLRGEAARYQGAPPGHPESSTGLRPIPTRANTCSPQFREQPRRPAEHPYALVELTFIYCGTNKYHS